MMHPKKQNIFPTFLFHPFLIAFDAGEGKMNERMMMVFHRQ
jgi:hypothetical protein